MVQIFNPNTVGKQILIDVKNINSDKLITVEMIRPLMDKVVEDLTRKRIAGGETQRRVEYVYSQLRVCSARCLHPGAWPEPSCHL